EVPLPKVPVTNACSRPRGSNPNLTLCKIADTKPATDMTIADSPPNCQQPAATTHTSSRQQDAQTGEGALVISRAAVPASRPPGGHSPPAAHRRAAAAPA